MTTKVTVLFVHVQPVTGKVGDRSSALVMRAAPSDLEGMKSRRSSEIFESLQLVRQRSYEQAKQERKKLIEAWKEQGWYTYFVVGLCDCAIAL